MREIFGAVHIGDKLCPKPVSYTHLSGGADLGVLGQKIHDGYTNFNVKNYGYSTFAKFVQSIPDLEVRENAEHIKKAYYRPRKK